MPPLADSGLAHDVQRLLAELTGEAGWPVLSSQCTPAMDLIDTGDAYEIVIDLPGVAPGAVRVLVKHDLVVVTGEKRPAACSAAASARFHLAERAFGRFARVVRLAAAIDGTRTQAALTAGALRLTIPKIRDRRARDVAVPIVHVP